MKLGNFVLRCAFLQIFLVFALYSYAQSADEDVHKYKMIEAINSGNYEKAAKEIVNVKDWTFEQSNENSYLDVDSFITFMSYAESSLIEKCYADSLCLYIVDELYIYNSISIKDQAFKVSIALLEAILSIQQQILGTEHLEYAISLHNLAYVYSEIDNYGQAEILYKEALFLKEKILGVEHPTYVESLHNLAFVYSKMGNYEQAEEFYEQVLQVKGKVLGVDHPDYILTLEHLANLYNLIGKYEQAKLFYKKILDFTKDYYGIKSFQYTISLHNLADIYYKIGDYVQSKSLYKDVLSIEKELYNTIYQPEYASTLINLGNVYFAIGDYVQAKTLCEEALEINKKVFGIEHLAYAQNLNNLATIHYYMGDYKNAELLHKGALEIRKKILGIKHPDYAISLINLAEVYSALGNYFQAELLNKEALEIYEKVLGVEHPDYALCLNNLAGIYFRMSNYSQAEVLIKDVLKISKKILGVEHPSYVTCLNNLAEIYSAMGNYFQAESLQKEAMEILGKVFGTKHPDYAVILNNLAEVYSALENYIQAEIFHKEALEIRKQVLGMNHPDYASSLGNLAFVYLNSGSYEQVEPLFIEHSNKKRKYIKNNFEFLSEKERQLYWNTESYHFDTYYPSFCYSYYSQKKSISEFAYNNAILTKGLLLNASTKVQNAILNSGNQTLIDQWNELCGLRQQIVFLQNKTLEEQEKAGVAALEERANELDKQLTASSSEFKQGKEIWNIEWNDVKKKLKSNEVAIEFISFDYYHKGEFTDSTLYCALLLRNNSQYPEMITLFEEKDILPYISSKTEANVTNKIYDFYANGEVIKNKIWGNILPKIKEGETVYFSPSGLFHQLAIESLPYDENRKMSDVYNLVRLSSTREIVLNKNNTNQYTTATLYGGIHYDTSSKELLAESNNYSQETLLASRGVENDTLDRGSVNYLPGTKKEVEKINKMLVDNNITAQLYTMNQANEESFKNLSNKHQNIIHIGTHGFTWTDSVAKKKDYFAERMQMIGDEQQYRGPIIDPLNRCGLLFAGANIALQGKSRELPEGVQDGILTAKEISLLDLRDCDLVVLSACETAKGDITSEGVFGLQRAFKIAGVQTIIMSLWKVNDEATQMLMTEFYNNWIVKKQSKREAFNNAQNAVRKKYEEPEYWAGFVMLD